MDEMVLASTLPFATAAQTGQSAWPGSASDPMDDGTVELTMTYDRPSPSR